MSPTKTSAVGIIRSLWLVLLALVIWGATIMREESWAQIHAMRLVGWTVLAWVALRTPNGVPWFLLVLSRVSVGACS